MEDLEPLGNGVLPLTFDRADTSVGVTGGSHGSAYFYDADPSEPSIQYVEKTTSDVPLEPGTGHRFLPEPVPDGEGFSG